MIFLFLLFLWFSGDNIVAGGDDAESVSRDKCLAVTGKAIEH